LAARYFESFQLNERFTSDNDCSPRAAGWLLLLTFLLAATASGQVPAPTPEPADQLRVTRIDTPLRHYWGATVADFNRDGRLDIFIGGHLSKYGYRGAAYRDRIYYGADGGVTPSIYAFPLGDDRHACAAADVNGDGWPDLYCQTGAARGTELNPNELFLGVQGYSFRKVRDDHGALDPSGRGRRPLFFNYNGDDLPDLLTTATGERQDGAPNASWVYVNNGGVFQRQGELDLGQAGSRCGASGDVNRDGFDDLLLCAPKSGLHLLINQQGKGFRQFEPEKSGVWWSDVQLADINRDGHLDLVGLRGSGVLEIRYGSGEATGFGTLHKRTLIKPPVGEPAKKIGAAGFAVSDINRDGHLDLFIVRFAAADGEGGESDAADLIYLGPRFARALLVPLAAAGRGCLARGLESGFVRVNAGVNWTGSVELVTWVPETPVATATAPTAQP
jgi:hypothetical protein